MTLEELLDGMRSEDPAVRDGSAYRELAEGIASGALAGRHDVIRAHTVESLRSPHVQARTFAPLVLHWLVLAGDRDRAAFDAAARWYLAEEDVRGYDDRLGWLHAVAHGADYFGAAADAGIAPAAEVLSLLARRAVSPGPGWVDQENARLADAVLVALRRGGEDALPAFTAPLAAALDAFEETAKAAPGRPPTWLSNTYSLLTTLYVAAAERPAALDGAPAPWCAALRREAAVLTARMTPWLFTPRTESGTPSR